MAFVFYDTETTGLQTGFDQILQFAAIKTDDNLNELDRFNIRCRLLPYVVPSPAAMKATRVTAEMLIDSSLPSHLEAMQQIHGKITDWSPAIFVGYNTMDFDEELLRQGFYRSLLPLYPTSMGGNTRADILQLTRAARLYAPDAIRFPVDAKGNIVLKLDQLAPENGFDHRDAHEAISDVEATIFIARAIRDSAPGLWDSMMAATRKQQVSKRLQEERPLVFTPYYFGRPYPLLVTLCGVHAEIDSQLAVFDLTFDPTEIMNESVEALTDRLGASKKPIRTVKANAQPILMPADSNPGRAIAEQIGELELVRRVEAVAGNQNFHERVGQALAGRYADAEPSPYVEKQIYDGFFSNADSQRMRRFRGVDWDERCQIVAELEDERLREQGERLIYAEHPDLLSADKRTSRDRWLTERILGAQDDVPWMTIPKALVQADDLMQNANPTERTLLEGIKQYIERLARQCGP